MSTTTPTVTIPSPAPATPAVDLPLLGDGRTAPRLEYKALPQHVRGRYPVSTAKFAGDAIAEREGLLPVLTRLNAGGWPCAGWAGSSQARCTQPATRGHLTCVTHGGRMPKGAAHPKFQHGGRAQYLPLRYQATYQEALNDPDLGSLRRDLATTETRIQDLLERLDTGENAGAWHRLHKELLPGLAKAILGGAGPKMLLDQIQALDTVVNESLALQSTWREVFTAQAHRADLVMKEHKRIQELTASISSEDLAILLGILMERLRSIATQLLPDLTARQLLGAFGQECQAALQGGRGLKRLPAPTKTREPGTRRHGPGLAGQGMLTPDGGLSGD